MIINKESITTSHNNVLSELGRRARSEILKMTTIAGSGHPGGSISSVDVLLTTLFYSNVFKKHELIQRGSLVLDDLDLSDIAEMQAVFELRDEEDHDLFILSHGHTAPAWYATLGAFGIVNRDDYLGGLRRIDSPFTGHVEDIIPLVSWDTGSLGQGLSAACAKALYYKHRGFSSHIWVFMGDGEQQKGQISEARRFIRKYGLTNLTVIIDYNQIQINGKISDVMPQNLAGEWAAAGFETIAIDGHDFNQIYESLQHARADLEHSHVIVADTVSGHGVSFMENNPKYVSSVLSYEACRTALEELGSEDNLEAYRVLRSGMDFTPYFEQYVERRQKHVEKFNGTCHSEIAASPSFIYPKETLTDCRTAYSDMLKEISKELTSYPLYVFDCDLAIALKTDGYMKDNPDYFIQSGIQEHHTATCAGALSKEEALVFFSDFGVFGFYEAFNQHNLNSLNDTNLKLVLSHTGMVGEDGKTHHCSNYISLANSIFGLKLITVADPNQTLHALKYAARNHGNFCICLGRSPMPVVCGEDGQPYFGTEYEFNYGEPDVIFEGSDSYFISTGSIFGEVYKAAVALREAGHKIGLIHISSPLALSDTLVDLLNHKKTIIVEDHNKHSGLYKQLTSFFWENNMHVCTHSIGLEDYALSGNYADQIVKMGMDAESLIKFVNGGDWDADL